MEKTVNVVMLPTKDKTRLIDNHGRLAYFKVKPVGVSKNCIPQHLYFTSDEEVKEGDNVLVSNKFIVKAEYVTSHIFPNDKGLGYTSDKGGRGVKFVKEDRKVVATTDKSLETCQCNKIGYHKMSCKLRYQIPQINPQFTEVYVKAKGKIDKVDLEYELRTISVGDEEDYADNLTIKTREDNTVIVHQIKEKVYTRDQVEALIHKATLIDNDKFDFFKWIEENL